MGKRMLSLFLALCMVVSLIPAPALAAEDGAAVLVQETGLSGMQGDLEDTDFSVEAAYAGDSVEPRYTGDSVEPAYAGDSVEPAYAGDFVESGYTNDSGEAEIFVDEMEVIEEDPGSPEETGPAGGKEAGSEEISSSENGGSDETSSSENGGSDGISPSEDGNTESEEDISFSGKEESGSADGIASSEEGKSGAEEEIGLSEELPVTELEELVLDLQQEESGADQEDTLILEYMASEVQAMIDALPTVEEAEGMREDPEAVSRMMEAAYAAWDAWEALPEEERLLVDTAKLDALLAWLNQGISPASEAPDDDEEDEPYLLIYIDKGNQRLKGNSIQSVSPYAQYPVGALLVYKDSQVDVTEQCTWTVRDQDAGSLELDQTSGNYRIVTKKTKGSVRLEASCVLGGETYSAASSFSIVNMKIGSNKDVLVYAALSNLSYTNFTSSQMGMTIGNMLEKGYVLQSRDLFLSPKAGVGETYASFYAALLSDWKLAGYWDLNVENGFVGVIFQDTGTGQYVIAYRGTEPFANGGSDIFTDGALGLGFDDEQFGAALELYDRTKVNGSSVTLTGHSLGGGLANLVSVLRGARAVTFNAPSTMVSAMVFYPEAFAANFQGLNDGLRADYVNPSDWVGNTGVGDNPESTAVSNVTFLKNKKAGGRIDPTRFVADQSGINGKDADPAAFHGFSQMIGYDGEHSYAYLPVISSTNPTAYSFSLRKRQYVLGSVDGDTLEYTSKSDAYVYGGAGDDTIKAKTDYLLNFKQYNQPDRICGGAGNDIIYGDPYHYQQYYYTKGDGCDVIYDTSGTDTIYLYGFASSILTAEVVTDNEGRQFYKITADGTEIMRLQKDGSEMYMIYVNGSDAVITDKDGVSIGIDGRGILPRGSWSYTYTAACPVNMYVCDASGSRVVSLMDGEELEEDCSYGRFTVSEQNGEYVKTAVLYDGRYTVELEGTGEGTMRYSCTVVEGDSVSSRTVTDVPVHDGALYTTFTDFNQGILWGDFNGDGTAEYEAEYAEPEGISLDTTEYTMGFADTLELTASVTPENASSEVDWSSSDPDVAWVDEQGLVTAMRAGSAVITASCAAQPDLAAECRITVSEGEISLEKAEISVEGVPCTYTGEDLEPEVSVTYKGMELTEGIHYTVEYENNLEPGTARIVIAGIGMFFGSVEQSFEIQEEGLSVEEQVARKVAQLVSLCEESGAETEYAKALWFHDWLINHADYDYSLTEYGAEGVLLKGKGVCQSYTLAYQALLDAADIENIVVTAPEMDHAWNIVKIGGSWTHIDCTWDDPNWGGLENHGYFGLSDEEMEKDHTWDHSLYPACYRIQRDISLEALPDPYEPDAPVEGIDFVLVDTGGNLLTRQDIAEEHTLLVFGRDGCGNTASFLSEITPWAEVLSENGLKVIVVYESAEEAAANAGALPFTCVSEADLGYARWDFLERSGVTGSYMYPLIVLQNRQGYAFYHSTGYVNNSERVLATALQELPETEEINAVPTYYYTSEEELEAAVESALAAGAQTLRLCNWKGEGMSTSDVNLVVSLLKQYGAQYGGQWTSYSIFGKTITFEIEYTSQSHVHQWVTVPAVAASCQSAGRTEYCFCTSCGMVLSEQVVIPTTDHDWSEWTDFTEATVFAPKQQHRSCLTCGQTQTRSVGGSLSPTMTVNTSALTMQVKQSTAKLTVTGLASGDSVKSWTSSNTKILKVTGKADGTCRLKAMNKTGKAVLTVTLQSGLTKTIKVTVQKGKVRTKSITGVTKNISLKKGKTWVLNAALNPITSQDKITYTTSNKKVAPVSGKGVIRGAAPGKAKITVKAGGKKVTCTVKVTR